MRAGAPVAGSRAAPTWARRGISGYNSQPLTFPEHASAQHVEHSSEVFGQARLRSHVRPGAGASRPAWTGCEHACGRNDVVCVELAAVGDEVERERFDGGGQQVFQHFFVL